MELINNQFLFSRPHLLSSGAHSQVVRFNCKPSHSRKVLPQRPAGESERCVLKFHTSANRLPYENELVIYRRLLETDAGLIYPRPIGYAEWSSQKYEKTIGRTIQSITGGEDASIFVLMLEFIEQSKPLSSVTVSIDIARAAISSLTKLHNIQIVHGDISTSNALVLEERAPARVMWIDFSSASIGASDSDLGLERRKAIDYFGAMVC
jgi:hypothetical protein